MADSKRWQVALIEAHPTLFHPEPEYPADVDGYPTCREGWQDILERACARITAALTGDGDVFSFAEIKEKYGTLRIYWNGYVANESRLKIEEAIALAEARSACICESCGAEGQLYRCGDWLLTACPKHARGEPVPRKIDNVHMSFRMIGSRARIYTCRLYDCKDDTFIDVPIELDTD